MNKNNINNLICSSDRNLKENIKVVDNNKCIFAHNVDVKSFNFKDDANKNIMYGVIAQEVQDSNLNELVYTKEDGHLAVDYTSLMILKIKYLEDLCALLNKKNMELENRISILENNK